MLHYEKKIQKETSVLIATMKTLTALEDSVMDIYFLV